MLYTSKTFIKRVSSRTSRAVRLRPKSAKELFWSRETFSPSTRDATPALSMYFTFSKLTMTRGVFLFADKIETRLAEFLRYVLSRQGRDDVAREGGYLPLVDAILQRERAKVH